MFIKAKTKVFLAASFIAFSAFTHTAVQAEDCKDLLKGLINQFDPKVAKEINLDDHLNHRNFIAQFAKKNGIPVFLKQNDRGVDVPVILLNKDTAPKLSGFLENSFGTQVALQKDWNNDHGLLRAGKYIIDLDTPGARGFGEINQTGLAWKNIDTYLPRRAAYGGSPTLEVAYLLTPEERSIVDYYQKVRRAALFRVKFTFGGNQGQVYPNTLRSGGEHCFIFCKAQAVSSHASEITSRLQALGMQNPQSVLSDAKIQKVLAQIQKGFNETDPGKVSPAILNDAAFFSALTPHIPANMTAEKKAETLSWLVSLDSTTRYAKVLRELGVSGNYGTEDAVSKRASAIFVYDEGASIDSFTNATYSNDGKFVSWPGTKQHPMN